MSNVVFGPFLLPVPYLHRAKDRRSWCYRRVVPADLKGHYPGREIIKSLGTRDDKLATRRCLEVNKTYEIEFERLRNGLPREPEPLRHQLGLALLRRFGIGPETFEANDLVSETRRDAFFDHLTEMLQTSISKEDYEKFFFDENADVYSKLPKGEKSALGLLHGKFALNASEYSDEYIRLRGREEDKKFVQDVRNAITFLLQGLPDKQPGAYKRHEVRELIDHHLQDGMKTNSVDRRMSTLRAMFNKVALELELNDDLNHAFRDYEIPHLGEDAKDREDFTFEQLKDLRNAEIQRSPEVIWLMHLMLDTGLRVNECCGLRALDIVLDDQQPYLKLQKNPFRRLKTKSSQRFVPLVGVAHTAVMDALDSAETEWLFPNYIDVEQAKTKNTSASAAVNKRIKVVLGEDAPTCHSFRHTMQTRLRNVGCPRDIRDELGGWSRTISDQYGSTADIDAKAKYLKASIDIRYRKIV